MSAYSQQSRNVMRTWILLFAFVTLVSTICYGMATYFGAPELAFLGLAVSLGQCFVAYFFGDKIALASSGAQQIDYDQGPQIHEMVTNLSKIAGIPTPKIYISPDKSANAFACGRSPKNASICLNEGLLDLLERSELEGVVAHEISHIKNRDILIMTVTMVLASVISFLADFGLRMNFRGSRSSDDNDNNSGSPIALILYLIMLVLAPILSTLIQMAVSRQREFLADATAVTLTRYPEGLIRALEKLYQSPVPSSHFSTAMSHFYITPPKQHWGQKMQNLFSTHPGISERVAALKQM